MVDAQCCAASSVELVRSLEACVPLGVCFLLHVCVQNGLQDFPFFSHSSPPYVALTLYLPTFQYAFCCWVHCAHICFPYHAIGRIRIHQAVGRSWTSRYVNYARYASMCHTYLFKGLPLSPAAAAALRMNTSEYLLSVLLLSISILLSVCPSVCPSMPFSSSVAIVHPMVPTACLLVMAASCSLSLDSFLSLSHCQQKYLYLLLTLQHTLHVVVART